MPGATAGSGIPIVRERWMWRILLRRFTPWAPCTHMRVRSTVMRSHAMSRCTRIGGLRYA
jgi:hypothetical protein